MLDWIFYIVGWLLAVAGLAPIVLAISSLIYDIEVRPRLIPLAEVEAMADAVMRDHPDDPEGFAWMEEHAAWYRSHSFEQGKWHRVRKVIRHRLLSSDCPPAAPHP